MKGSVFIKSSGESEGLILIPGGLMIDSWWIVIGIESIMGESSEVFDGKVEETMTFDYWLISILDMITSFLIPFDPLSSELWSIDPLLSPPI
jgi:hypothetical protein